MSDLCWCWCETCKSPMVWCEYCGNMSCNGSGCEKCDDMFKQAVAVINAGKAPSKEEILRT